jgi:TatD DNase family protein
VLIDTHCHFNHERFALDLPECLERAEMAGVRQMVVVGYNLESSEQAVALAERYAPVLFAAVAVHPHDACHWNAATADRLRELAANPRVVAIGEIGLDFHYDFSPRPDQDTAFRAQLALAQEVGLPVIIHCREAYPETLAALAAEGIERIGGVMHCWAGTPSEAEQAVGLGMYLGFGGTLTFKNAESTREAARAIPLERLLVETDAPYLAPVPHRGQRNEPAYTRLVAEKLAELRGLAFPDLAALTTANAQKLFARLRFAGLV